MYTRAVFFASSLILTAGTSPALAADIYAPSAGGLKDPVIQQEIILPEATTYQEYAEWYIRGDLGVGKFNGLDGTGQADSTTLAIDDLEFDNVFSGSIGFGRYITPNVRIGLDVDYRKDETSTFNTGDLAAVAALTNMGSIPLEYTSTSVMINAVYDFAPNRRFSPYLGGGVGWAFHELKLNGTTFYNDNNGDLINETGTVRTTKSSSNSFTANLVTGVSVNLRKGLFLDMGYKFSYLGDADLDFDYNHSAPAKSGSGNIGLDDIMTHEFKIGLRYDLY